MGRFFFEKAKFYQFHGACLSNDTIALSNRIATHNVDDWNAEVEACVTGGLGSGFQGEEEEKGEDVESHWVIFWE